eukprot:TRINITY_DN18195_c0_g1_i3.p1 TRINITY_DN18195_c0_g1~~TRINITY_DN18195_c0_g1_i3.p1  ORF type:complete len:197 (-),score=47.16 TRINITY_DN18195_c0_g1_i3:76-666(-)
MCIRDRGVLEQLETGLTTSSLTPEPGVNFEGMERSVKQLEIRALGEDTQRLGSTAARSAPAPKLNLTAQTGLSSSNAAPDAALTRAALGEASQGRVAASPAGRATAAPMASPGDSLSKSAIYVNSLPTDAKEADIVAAFQDCGGIKMVNARHIATGGFAFVFFDSDDGAQKALETARVEVKGKLVNVLAKKQIPGA